MRARSRKGQRGHLMVGLMASVTIMVIFSTMAFQAWQDVLRRDLEAEMIFRGQDIARAVYRYRLDHGGTGPLEFDLLAEPGPKGQYYIRQLWEDPLVKGGKWGILYMGPGGQIVDPNFVADQAVEGLGLDSGGSAFGRGSGLNPSQRGQPGRDGRGRNRQRGPRQGAQGGQQGQQGQPGQALPGTVMPGDGTGLPIAGVRSLCEDEPFRVYNGLTDYGEWLFTYLDYEGRPNQQNQQRRPNQNTGGAGGAITNNP
ncbi:MAG: type II secretion system protein [bacterium]|nr:type II secretion system protein [bacterium]